MNKKLKRMAVMFLSFALAFTALPMLDGGLSSEAKAAKKIYVSARATGYYTASISWNKIKKPQSGYALFRDGVVIAHFGKKTTSYSDAGLAAGSYHTYQVKAYKKKTTKKKMWRNKYTGELRKKRPKKGKKDWKKKTIKTVKYTYKKSSNVASVSTPAKPASTAPATKPSSGGGSSGGGSTTPTTETKTVTNYKGEVTTVTDLGNGWLNCVKAGSTQAYIMENTNASWASLDKTVNGDFGNYRQIDGATFQVKGGGISYPTSSIASPKYDNTYGYALTAYNVDDSKLSVDMSDSSFVDVNSYKWDPDKQQDVPNTVKYVVKDGKRLFKAGNTSGKLASYNASYSQVRIHLAFATDNNCWVGYGLGIHNGTAKAKLYYNGKYVGELTASGASDVQSNGMTLKRRQFYAVAETAINAAGGSSGTIQGDHRIIADWIKANITHGQSYDTGYGTITTFGCQQAVGVLETWLIYNYGEAAWGFAGGSANQSADHIDYALNTAPSERLRVFFKN